MKELELAVKVVKVVTVMKVIDGKKVKNSMNVIAYEILKDKEI